MNRALRAPFHLADLAKFAATRGAREREDTVAHRQLQVGSEQLPLPAGLAIEWLGVAGYRLSYEEKVLLVDPYVTRVPFSHVLRRRPALPDHAAIERLLPADDDVVGILIGHTHFDHAVDAPALARRHGCPVLGSSSLVNLMGLHGLGEQAVAVEPRRRYELGPYTVSFVPSRHSRLLLGMAVPYDGELTCSHLDGLAPSAYRCGQVWGIRIEVAGASLYHQGSADLLDDEVPTGGVDVFLAGVAGRSFTQRYWERLLPRLDPKVVVASHYDDFFKPLDAPMGFAANVRLADVPEEISKVSRDVEVATLGPRT